MKKILKKGLFKKKNNKEALPQPAQSPENAEAVSPPPRKRKKNVKKWIKNIIKILLLLALAAGIFFFVRFKTGRKNETPPPQTTSEATRGGFDCRITGSGTVTPIESYTLSPLITGKILQCDYEEGQYVEKGAVLYRFEDTDAQTKIKAAETALKSAQRSVESADKAIAQAAKGIEDAKQAISDAQKDIDDIKERMGKLTVKAPAGGMVEDLSASVGDTVSGTLCRVLDYNNISTTVSFNSLQIQSIKTGDRVSVGISRLMTSVGGYVEKKYTAPHSASDGTIMYSVKIRIDGGVNLAAGTTVSVTVHTDSGDVECPSFGTVTYAEPKAVELEEGGEITALYVENGNHVSKGSVVARLRSEALEKELKNAESAYRDRVDALKDAQDNYDNAVASRDNQLDGVETAQAELDNAIKSAEDYVITSPVTGVILEKHYKAGDTYGNDDNKKLMVVADMSKMVFSMNVDELDISNIQLGQTVNVTADALPGEMIQGTITTASKIGNAENGVTGYPIQITIDEPGNLMSGMNVTAEIVVGSVQDAVIAPASAIFLIDGAYYATIVTPGKNEGDPETEEQVPVTVGLHNDEFYEIIDGLKEGDILRDSGIGSSNEDEMMYYAG